jgi:hypothetical protein
LAIEPPVSPAAPTSKTLVDIIIQVIQNGEICERGRFEGKIKEVGEREGIG